MLFTLVRCSNKFQSGFQYCQRRRFYVFILGSGCKKSAPTPTKTPGTGGSAFGNPAGFILNYCKCPKQNLVLFFRILITRVKNWFRYCWYLGRYGLNKVGGFIKETRSKISTSHYLYSCLFQLWETANTSLYTGTGINYY